MKSLRWLIVMLPLLFVACAAPEPPAPPPPPATKAYSNLLQLMRAIPFPHSNVIFDTQGKDPSGAEKATAKATMVYSLGDSDVYAGWPAVENSALAISETANLLTIPRKCASGVDAPIDREDWKMYVAGLAAAGEAAYAAAQTKDMDKMLEVSETVTLACSACHDVYRDRDETMRCVPPPAAGAAPAAAPEAK